MNLNVKFKGSYGTGNLVNWGCMRVGLTLSAQKHLKRDELPRNRSRSMLSELSTTNYCVNRMSSLINNTAIAVHILSGGQANFLQEK